MCQIEKVVMLKQYSNMSCTGSRSYMLINLNKLCIKCIECLVKLDLNLLWDHQKAITVSDKTTKKFIDLKNLMEWKFINIKSLDPLQPSKAYLLTPILNRSQLLETKAEVVVVAGHVNHTRGLLWWVWVFDEGWRITFCCSFYMFSG